MFTEVVSHIALTRRSSLVLSVRIRVTFQIIPNFVANIERSRR